MEASALLASLSAELGSRRPTTRARAALLLTRPGIPAVVEQIVPLLGDPDPDVRLVACSGLARAATPRAAEALIWALVPTCCRRSGSSSGSARRGPWRRSLRTLREGPSAGRRRPRRRRAARRRGRARREPRAGAGPRPRPARRGRAAGAAAQRTRGGAGLRRARARARRRGRLRAGADRRARIRGLAGSRPGREVARRARRDRRARAARALPFRPRLVGARQRGPRAARARRARDRGAAAHARARRSLRGRPRARAARPARGGRGARWPHDRPARTDPARLQRLHARLLRRPAADLHRARGRRLAGDRGLRRAPADARLPGRRRVGDEHAGVDPRAGLQRGAARSSPRCARCSPRSSSSSRSS